MFADADLIPECMEARRQAMAGDRSARFLLGMRFAPEGVMRRPRKKGNTGISSEPTSDSSVATMPEEARSAAPQSVGDTTIAAPDRDRIAMRAYELYLARGGSEGGELDDWLAAERELRAPSGDHGSE